MRITITLMLILLLVLVEKSQASTEPQVFTIEQISADFAQLYDDLQLSHYDMFANLSKTEYDRQYLKYQEGIARPMTRLEVQLYFQRFVALGDIGHARIDLPISEFFEYLSQGGKILPLYIKINDGEVVVDDVVGNSIDLQRNDRVVAINGKPIADWLAEFRALLSADSDELAATLIESQLPFLVWLLVGDLAEYRVTVSRAEKSIELTVPALTRVEQQAILADTEEHVEPAPQRDAKILPNGVAYLRPGPFYNIQPDAVDVWDNRPFKQFIDQAFAQFIEADAQTLLIDLRNNPGGTNSFSDLMIAWFADQPFKFASDFVVKVSPHSVAANQERLEISDEPNDISLKLAEFYASNESGERFSFALPEAVPREDGRYNGKVYVLINRYSYSNAVSVAAIAKDYGFATVIGEPTADLATTFGGMERFSLAHTDISVGYPKALIIRPNGDQTPGGVRPDIAIPLDAEQLFDDEAFLASALGMVTSNAH